MCGDTLRERSFSHVLNNLAFWCRGFLKIVCDELGMKKLIRQILDDLNKKPQRPLPQDLDNQILSKNPAQRTRQLDQQAQENEQQQSS